MIVPLAGELWNLDIQRPLRSWVFCFWLGLCCA
jgi:hypothetical protein